MILIFKSRKKEANLIKNALLYKFYSSFFFPTALKRKREKKGEEKDKI